MATPTFDCKITTPMALNEPNSAKATLRWFVHGAEYNPRAAEVRILVNGQRAFGSIYQDILNAKHSIDIICWGFQPSMYFVRDGGKSMRIGELLAHKGEKDVKVRLLCWHDPTTAADVGENNMPGFDQKMTLLKRIPPTSVFQSSSLLSEDYQTIEEMEFDLKWYQQASYGDVTNTVHKNLGDRALADLSFTRMLPSSWGGPATNYLMSKVAGFKNLELATRSFDPSERADIVERVRAYGKKAGWNPKLINGMSMAMGGAPTHHQKVILIDYEDPSSAVGYVMGHNMLDQYWDTDEHKAKPATPRTGRSGPSPWQDISSRVTGPILQDLNANFCEAWDLATSQKLTEARKKLGLDGKHDLCLAGSSGERGVMAQILRTQSQHGKTEIRKLYLQALNNATQYVFVQNQYFRWDEFADTIKQVAIKHQKGGRDSGAHGPIYLFVITNSSDAAVGQGTYSTYKMLESLGYSDRMPNVKYLETDEKLVASEVPIESQLAKAQQEEKRVSSQGYSWDQLGGVANYVGDLRAREGALSGEIAEIEKQRNDIKPKPESPPDPHAKPAVGAQIIAPDGTAILKLLICTLVAPDSPPTAWVPVYVHAKLGIIDDAFTTLGSANINFRSMNVDSEMNIALENGEIARRLRQQLWGLHTRLNGSGSLEQTATSSDPKGEHNEFDDEFTNWSFIVGMNKTAQSTKRQRPVASLVEFRRESGDRSYKD